MTVISITTKQPLADSQADYEVMERDFADDKKRLAYRIFMGRAGELEYHLGEPFSTDVTGRTCCLCGGMFPAVGRIFGFWNGPAFVYLHRGCLHDSEDWSK